jgi:acyl-phosphate glycerol 3-phosphate acyltransferase
VSASSFSLFALSVIAVAAAYLCGSIPFGYLVARWVRGIDIRTVGSGNLGATNVGRTLGFRYFWLVLFLDLLKGYLPTFGFPWLLNRFHGSCPVDLPVLLALAAILGHTFPIYLGFRGGKGVATSLGGVLALDPVSCGFAALAFAIFVGLTRYVSLSALLAGVVFVAAHFLREPDPVNRNHIAMTLFSIAVLILLFVRHRSNLARIWAGTESRVSFGRRRGPKGNGQPQSCGKISVMLLAGLVVFSLLASAGIWVWRQTRQPLETNAGPWHLREIDRTTTGQQRVDRVVFAQGGNRLAALCPRYDRLVIYDLTSDKALSLSKEVALEGRPVALVSFGDRFIVLERPHGDERHVEPGWWEVFDLDGNHTGSRNLAGFYPDDLAVSIDGRHLFVISSGQAEGDPKKPLPALEAVAVDLASGSGRTLHRVEFDPRDDPARLALSASGRYMAVLMAKTNQVVGFDVSVPGIPNMVGRTKPSAAEVPYVSQSADSDWIMMPVSSPSEAIAISSPTARNDRSSGGGAGGGSVPSPDFVICARHRDSVVELMQNSPLHPLGRLPLTGPLNIGRTRPTGLAYSPERGLLAISTRSGSIHLLELAWRQKHETIDRGPIAIAPDGAVRR